VDFNAWYPRLTAAMMSSGLAIPDEGLGSIVGLGEEAIDGGLEVDERAEDAPLVWRMISLVPKPSAVSNTIRERQTCFWRLLRAATIASSRSRSAVLTLTLIAIRILKTRTAASPRESTTGLLCQT
jgi:hypothetical protein